MTDQRGVLEGLPFQNLLSNRAFLWYKVSLQIMEGLYFRVLSRSGEQR